MKFGQNSKNPQNLDKIERNPSGLSQASALREHRRINRLRLVLIPLVVVLVVSIYEDFLHRLPWGNINPPIWSEVSVTIIILIALLSMVYLARPKSQHTIFRPTDIETSLNEIVGIPNAITEVERAMRLFTERKLFSRELGSQPSWGVIFEGDQGMGKLLVAKAIAKEASIPILVTDAAGLVSPYGRQTRKKINDFFKDIKRVSRVEGGSIGVIEGIDRLVPAISTSLGSEAIFSAEGELLLQIQSLGEPTVLSRMGAATRRGMERIFTSDIKTGSAHRRHPNIFLIGTTTEQRLVDGTLTQIGFLDRTITFEHPSLVNRSKIVRHHLNVKAHDSSLEGEEAHLAVASMTSGYTLSRLESLMNEALIMALSDKRKEMTFADVTRAKLGLEFGQSEVGESTKDEIRRIALHESAHAVVAYCLGEGRTLDVISILRRKETLGLLHHTGSDESSPQKRSELDALLRILMAGLAAEEKAYEDASSGPATDLMIATQIASAMIGSFGMGRTLVSFPPLEDNHLSDFLPSQVMADPDMRVELEELLASAYQEATDLVDEKWHIIEHLADVLMENDELISRQIIDAIEEAS